MSFLNTINNLSFKKITGLGFFIALLMLVPVTAYVFQQQTKTGSKADFKKPEPIVPGKTYGAPSFGNPQITLVWPFLGKVGDVVLIQGENLGNNPVNKELRVGTVVVPENDINKWTPTLIEFSLPQGASSGPIRLRVVDKTASWPFPFTVYTVNTKPQVTENNNIVRVLKGPVDGTLVLYFRDNTKLESKNFDSTPYPQGKSIISLEVKDRDKNPVPFFVEPEEFGF